MRTVAAPAETVAGKLAWTRSVTETLADFSTDSAQGLKSQDASERQSKYGHNQLRSAKSRHVGSIIFDQFKGVVILLLAAAGTLAILFSDHVEGLAIFAVIAINATIGFLTEWRAIRSMEEAGRSIVISHLKKF